jgi:predicted metal-dependent HD superfamily phosphohydrolase
MSPHVAAADFIQTLLRRWAATCEALGCRDAAACQALGDSLLHRYAEPQRKYHTVQHLAECLHQLDVLQAVATHPHEVAFALWFHDAIYDLQRHDNEARSADWARASAMALGMVDAAAPERIHALVLATRHQAQPATPDEQVLVDVDLSILGVDARRFDEYEAQIRQEYAHVPEALFRTKRAQVLHGFLERSRIYLTDAFHSRYEAAARANLARSLAGLA